MNVNSAGSVPASIASAPTGDAVAITVLKKSLDIQAQSAMQLIAALPQVQSAPGTTPTLGISVNTFA